MCICKCVCVHMCTEVCAHVYRGMCVNRYVLFTFTEVCVCMCVFRCLHTCLHLRTCIYVFRSQRKTLGIVLWLLSTFGFEAGSLPVPELAK